MDNPIEIKVKKVMSAVFGIQVDIISEDSSSKTIDSWDSLKHMNLIVALEKEFSIEFTDTEIIGMLDYSSIIKSLKNK